MTPPIAATPLPSLLWTTLRRVERAHDEAGAGSSGMPSLPEWANLLRALNCNGVERRDLPCLLRLSKRAVTIRLGMAVRRRWALEADAERGHATVRLTATGSEVAARWPGLCESAEREWRRVVGATKVRTLRATLEALVAHLPFEFSHYPAGYGAADERITGGHGRDWKAVPRASGHTVSGLPISALLSQALVAFAIAYEGRSEVALTLASFVLIQVPAEGRPARELGHTAGVSALKRHGFLRVEPGPDGERLYLTAAGRDVSNLYQERVRDIERCWTLRFGQSVADVREALENVNAAAGPEQ